jgi:hypothetical protein
MKMELQIVGYDEHNEPVYQEWLTPEEIGVRLKETKEGKAFLKRFDLDDEHNSALFNVVIQRLGEDYTLDQARGLLKTVVQAGGFVTIHEDVRVGNTTFVAGQYKFARRPAVPEPEPEPEPEVPAVDARGHLLGASQKAWSEFRQYAESHSTQDCKERAKVDNGFASFVRKNLEREMNQGVGDEVINLNARTHEPNTPTPELRAWATEYHKTPTEKLRQLKRADTNPFGYVEWNRNFEAAIAAGLI